MRAWPAAVLAASLALGAPPPPRPRAPGSMHLGLVDSSVSFDPDPALRAQWLDRISGLGADRIRIAVNWRGITTRAPAPGEDPADPAWPGYRWGGVDAAVAEATARGLTPIVSINGAPDWAEGPDRPASAPPGSWRPDPAALGAFARAAALRYPGVRYWQAWNEPNLNIYLTPQWLAGKPASPAHYRLMLNAFYDAVKAVNPANRVITAGTAPFGDPGTSGKRMRPARFDRELFCVSGAACANPAKFDVLSHHPYSVGGPNRKALNADDVSVPDLDKLVKPLRQAERTGRVGGARHHAVWVTELSWDSSPPDPLGVPAQQAGALAGGVALRPVAQRRRHRDLVPRARPGADAVLRRHLPVRRLPARRDAQALGDGLRVPVRRGTGRGRQGPAVGQGARRRPGGRAAQGERTLGQRRVVSGDGGRAGVHRDGAPARGHEVPRPRGRHDESGVAGLSAQPPPSTVSLRNAANCS